MDVTSTTKGLLPPRMTQAQRNAIVSPAAGLLIWCTNCGASGEFQGYNGTTWTNLIGGTASAGIITGLTCGSATNNGTLTSGTAASDVNSAVPYTGGNGATHSGQTVTSAGVTGLTATLSAGTFASGSGSLTYTITGTPASSGTVTFALNIGGQTCTLTRTVRGTIAGNTNCTNVIMSAVSCASVSGATINDNGATTLGIEYDWTGATTSGMANTSTTRALVEIGGQCWMRFNMDAVPSAFNPVPALNTGADVGWSGYYTGGPFANEGRLYQWKAAMNNATTERSQGVCPTGWHIPSHCEISYLENTLGMSTAEQMCGHCTRTSGSVHTKLSSGGLTGFDVLYTGTLEGSFSGRGTYMNLWSSTPNVTNHSMYRQVSSGNMYSHMSLNYRGFSVRCLKD